MACHEMDEDKIKRLVQDEAMQLPDLGIAVAGIAGRFPKSESINEFEDNLFNGIDLINDEDDLRFPCRLWDLPPRAGRMKDLKKFDNEFFGYTLEEANYTDFQMRILYEVVYESILDAGVNPYSLRGTRTGVYFGLHCNEFENAMADDPKFKTNGYYAQSAVKVAQFFDLRGCTVTFDAACASGFVGLHCATEAMENGLIDQAIVCSSNIPVTPTGSFIFLQMQMLSPTGKSRFLDAQADGYVKSEACVSVFLQHKDIALRNYASIMATQTSVDGYKQEGITFPSYKCQESLIRSTKLRAQVRSDHVQYLEAHGTGTPAGDPQEVRAISNVYHPSDDSADKRSIGPLLVGSVKTNMGHSEAASGLCSLAKVALMFENELIYKGLHYEKPNENIEALMEGKLKFIDKRTPLLGKIVPLSCYGFGGSNVHIILRANEAPAISQDSSSALSELRDQDTMKLIVMFGRNSESLNYFFDRMMDQESRHTRYCLTDDFISLLDSLNATKIDRLMSYRGYLVVKQEGNSFKELSRNIRECNLLEMDEDCYDDLGRKTHFQDCVTPKCNLLFPGLGCQWTGMASGLTGYKPFWPTITRLADHVESYGIALVKMLSTPDHEFTSMREIFVSIVAYQIALVNIIKDQVNMKQQLSYTVGHSLGEISCAYAAGSLSELEAILVALQIGGVLDDHQNLIEGRMLVVNLNEAQANESIARLSKQSTIKVACVNGPNSVTLSGRTAEIEQLASALESEEIYVQLISNCNMALHNELIMSDTIKLYLEQAISQVLTRSDKADSSWISSINPDLCTEVSAKYFANNLCSKVDFLSALKKMNENLGESQKIFLELGPTGLFESQIMDLKYNKCSYVKMMKRDTKEPVVFLLQSLGQLYQAGAILDLSKLRSHKPKIARRQTPSLSSLFRWQHEIDFFVPKYPNHFSKSSAKSETPIDILQDKDKYIADHCVEGRILYPATGYLLLVWRVFSFTQRKIYDANFQDLESDLVPIEFHNVRLLRAVILNMNKSSQIYTYLEEGTGRFEIKEGGSLVVEGYVRSPTENPTGLLYEKVGERLRRELESSELNMKTDDVYKQFRLSGYDYGPDFQCIEAASSDGKRSRVKFNGHFVSLTDSILQSVFMAVSEYAPSGGLFLPTKLEYVRFQPDLIIPKFKEAGWRFDLSEGMLSVAGKREIMSKIMEREKRAASGEKESDSPSATLEEKPAEPVKEKDTVIFDTYCEPETGIIITDGIEMRGVKATPVARKGTGRFEIKEGGSLVVEGYVRSPTENPSGLLYEKVGERLRRELESSELNMKTDDVYKQFRLSGYDYGPDFQCIEAASSDGKRSRVKFNGHFVSLTDSILQSVFMAVSEYAPSGGLFLPTKLEYVRFQPDLIIPKFKEAGWRFDLSEGMLSVAGKREIMSKIMEREKRAASGEKESDSPSATLEEKPAEPVKEKGTVIFDTYCEPETGIIITDGIEMRGVKATPVARRLDSSNEPLLESYMFIPDIEESIQDEAFLAHERILMPYARACDAMAIELLDQTIVSSKVNNNYSTSTKGLLDQDQYLTSKYPASEAEVQAYKDAYLVERFDSQKANEYRMEANGNRTLMSVLDQLIARKANLKQITELVHSCRAHLMRDLMQSPQTNERFIRPIMETVLENCVLKGKSRVRMLEVNPDDGIIASQLRDLAEIIAPQIGIDYELAHPDPNRLGSNILPTGIKTHPMRGSVQKLLGASDGQQAVVTGNLDFVIYKDVSCYSLPKRQIEGNGLTPVLNSLCGACTPGGFILVIMRHSLTFGERLLLALADPELVGLNRQNLERWMESHGDQEDPAQRAALARIAHINDILRERCQVMLREGQRNKLVCVARKSEVLGSTLLLFRRPYTSEQLKTLPAEMLLRVSHEKPEDWLTTLKASFAAPKEEDKTEEKAEQVSDDNRIIWLCAVASKQRPVSGLPGLIQALGRELGFKRLRCFLDQHTFKDRDEPISLQDIENSSTFKMVKERGGLLWNCIDESGRFGSFRHLTINSFLAREDCCCSSPNILATVNSKSITTKKSVPCYVNTATRGDLSSLSWFEAPLKYETQDPIVRIAYSALNFRDVMIATGRLPLSAIPMQLAQRECLIGLEFSGIEEGTGKRVAVMVTGCGIATHAVCNERCSIKLEVPDRMSLKDAASIPTAYATVIMALVCRAQAKKGESILIHAASGAVGQAAIRLSKYLGLEIYATVGTPEKRKFLVDKLEVSSDKIFNSRDTTFEVELLRASRGRGVDMVLNSLAEDKLQASLRCLAPGGRFLEIGKYDMSVDTPIELSQLSENISFHGILLDMLFGGPEEKDGDKPSHFNHQLEVVRNYLNEGLREGGFIQPIEHKLFARSQVEDAFRFMAAGKHIGKLLIEIDSTLEKKKDINIESVKQANCIPRVQLNPKKSYIVTGGLGGFGLELVKWLTRKGANYLVLTSRSGIRTGYQRTSLRRLETLSKVHIEVVNNLDATTHEGAQQLVELAQSISPTGEVGGIFHLAMVLKDALVENLTEQDLELVCRPKVDMCIQLDSICRKSRGIKLDYFVAFSSVAAGKGNAGQSGYAYANSCMERICEQRRLAGEHGLAIQWGAVGDVGVAYENLGGNNIVIGGTIPQRIPSCLATLERLMSAEQFTVCSSLVPVRRSGQPGSGSERADLVGAILHVLGIKDSSKVSEEATLGELGLDSLMAVEIRQYIEREFDKTLNIQEIRSLTIAKIREIGAEGKAQAKGAASENTLTGSSEQPLKVVQNYGAQTAQVQDHLISTTDRDALIEGIASFIPDLEPPSAKFHLLNPSKTYPPTAMPIFFMPPIHGRFKLLELVCANIDYPCFGLTWTKELANAKSIDEVANYYLTLLRTTDWKKEFNYQGDKCVVNLVGYSYGATVAFEMMLSLHRSNQSSNGFVGGKEAKKILSGRLILLDGSPKQIEIASYLVSMMNSKKQLSRLQEYDELLMIFVANQLRQYSQQSMADYKQEMTSIRDSIVNSKTKSLKCQRAGEKLYKLLQPALLSNPKLASIKQESIAQTIESFCQKYELITDYKVSETLLADCTLIRAEKITYKSNFQEEKNDLDVGSVVRGQLDVFVMPGNHESFIERNSIEIASIITQQCRAEDPHV